MMHGREKSDSAIVAVKPTNNAVPTATEPVEPRAGAKGTRASKARTGHRDGSARWSAYGKPQDNGRRRGSPHSSTTSASTDCGWRSSRSNAGCGSFRRGSRAKRGSRAETRRGCQGKPRSQARILQNLPRAVGGGVSRIFSDAAIGGTAAGISREPASCLYRARS